MSNLSKKIYVGKTYEFNSTSDEPVDSYWYIVHPSDDTLNETFDSWAEAMSYVYRRWLGSPIPASFFRQSQWGNKVL